MLDFRHETFLALCIHGSFTKAAEHLHITQPAVSQHMKYLEEYYQCKLIDTANRKIQLTPQGKRLKEFALTVFSDFKHFKENMNTSKNEIQHFAFGATLSIGEYVMPDILTNLLHTFPELTFHMTVANTKSLLEQLNEGELDFILVEGLFDKTQYDTTLFSLEQFIPVCSPQADFAHTNISFASLKDERLILREKGSGTREIFEHILEDRNYSFQMFEKIIEIGNMAAIKHMVSEALGITFLFEVAARQEIETGRLVKMNVVDFDEKREFNFVTLKNSFFREQYLDIYHMLRQQFEEGE